MSLLTEDAMEIFYLILIQAFAVMMIKLLIVPAMNFCARTMQMQTVTFGIPTHITLSYIFDSLLSLDFCPARPTYTRKGQGKAYEFKSTLGKTTHNNAASVCAGDSASVPMFKSPGEATAAAEVFNAKGTVRVRNMSS